MSHLVVVEVGGGGEALPANLALVRLLARVDAAVSVERRARAERLPARLTRVRLLSCATHQNHVSASLCCLEDVFVICRRGLFRSV